MVQHTVMGREHILNHDKR